MVDSSRKLGVSKEHLRRQIEAGYSRVTGVLAQISELAAARDADDILTSLRDVRTNLVHVLEEIPGDLVLSAKVIDELGSILRAFGSKTTMRLTRAGHDPKHRKAGNLRKSCSDQVNVWRNAICDEIKRQYSFPEGEQTRTSDSDQGSVDENLADADSNNIFEGNADAYQNPLDQSFVFEFYQGQMDALVWDNSIAAETFRQELIEANILQRSALSKQVFDGEILDKDSIEGIEAFFVFLLQINKRVGRFLEETYRTKKQCDFLEFRDYWISLLPDKFDLGLLEEGLFDHVKVDGRHVQTFNKLLSLYKKKIAGINKGEFESLDIPAYADQVVVHEKATVYDRVFITFLPLKYKYSQEKQLGLNPETLPLSAMEEIWMKRLLHKTGVNHKSFDKRQKKVAELISNLNNNFHGGLAIRDLGFLRQYLLSKQPTSLPEEIKRFHEELLKDFTRRVYLKVAEALIGAFVERNRANHHEVIVSKREYDDLLVVLKEIEQRLQATFDVLHQLAGNVEAMRKLFTEAQVMNQSIVKALENFWADEQNLMGLLEGSDKELVLTIDFTQPGLAGELNERKRRVQIDNNFSYEELLLAQLLGERFEANYTGPLLQAEHSLLQANLTVYLAGLTAAPPEKIVDVLEKGPFLGELAREINVAVYAGHTVRSPATLMPFVLEAVAQLKPPEKFLEYDKERLERVQARIDAVLKWIEESQILKKTDMKKSSGYRELELYYGLLNPLRLERDYNSLPFSLDIIEYRLLLTLELRKKNHDEGRGLALTREDLVQLLSMGPNVRMEKPDQLVDDIVSRLNALDQAILLKRKELEGLEHISRLLEEKKQLLDEKQRKLQKISEQRFNAEQQLQDVDQRILDSFQQALSADDQDLSLSESLHEQIASTERDQMELKEQIDLLIPAIDQIVDPSPTIKIVQATLTHLVKNKDDIRSKLREVLTRSF